MSLKLRLNKLEKAVRKPMNVEFIILFGVDDPAEYKFNGKELVLVDTKNSRNSRNSN